MPLGYPLVTTDWYHHSCDRRAGSQGRE